MPDPARVLRTIRALAPSVIISVGVAVVGLYIVRHVVTPEQLRESNDVAGNYLQTLGTIYAVLLAFVVIVVWQQFNDARAYVEREANELLDLFRTAKGFSEPVRGKLQGHLRCYVDAVLQEEWSAMARGQRLVFARVSVLFDRVADVFHACELRLERERLLYSEAIACLNDLSDSRINRLTASCLKIPMALRILLYTGAAITVGSMYLFAVENFLLHAIMTGAMAGAVSHVLYIIADLDDPFAGDWQVPREPFERVRAYMEASAFEQESGTAVAENIIRS
jgi:hypothetical protein